MRLSKSEAQASQAEIHQIDEPPPRLAAKKMEVVNQCLGKVVCLVCSVMPRPSARLELAIRRGLPEPYEIRPVYLLLSRGMFQNCSSISNTRVNNLANSAKYSVSQGVLCPPLAEQDNRKGTNQILFTFCRSASMLDQKNLVDAELVFSGISSIS